MPRVKDWHRAEELQAEGQDEPDQDHDAEERELK